MIDKMFENIIDTLFSILIQLLEYRWSFVVLRPYVGECDLDVGFGWPGLKKTGVKISEVLKLIPSFCNALTLLLIL